MMCMASDYSWIKCPSPENIDAWRVFLYLGSEFDRTISAYNSIEFFAPEDFKRTLGSLRERHGLKPPEGSLEGGNNAEGGDMPTQGKMLEFRKGRVMPVLPPIASELAILLEETRMFPFLTELMPKSCVAASAILAYKYAETGSPQSINNIQRLFRLIGIPIEGYEKEGLALEQYCEDESSYLEVAVDSDDSSKKILILSSIGLEKLLGIQAPSPIPDSLAFEVMKTEGFSPVIPRYVRERQKRRKNYGVNPEERGPKVTLEDVAVSPETMIQLQALVNFAKKKQSQNWSLLLHGLPGVGKNFIVDAICGTLKRPLVTIDVSQVLGKYVGDNERNMTKYFAKAQEIGAILHIEECDSFLKARTSDNPIWENTAVNCLLALLEKKGVSVILSTNLIDSVDRALLRRVDHIIHLPLPGVNERKKIWANELKKWKLKVENIDLDTLAKIEISGGLISVACRRAYMLKVSNVLKNTSFDTAFFNKLAIEEQKKMKPEKAEKRIIGFGR